MPLYGRVEVQYWQLTPMGVQRLQTRTLRGLETADYYVLKELAELGGIAEVDELTVGSNISPGTINYSLRKLTDLGFVVPVTPQQEQVTQG